MALKYRTGGGDAGNGRKMCTFKAFGDVDAFPLCIKSNDVDEIVNTIYLISGSFSGVNLEDISAPRCFEIEKN